MRKFVLAAVLITPLLGGCATNGQPRSLDQIILLVQQATVALCRFEPAAGVVLRIINLGPINWDQLAHEFCAAVTPVPMQARRRGLAPTGVHVRGVRVQGRWVQ